MSDSWDDYADEWDNNSDAITYSNKAYETLTREVNIEGKNILDFGCGTGLLTERMAMSAKNIVALDSSKNMIAVLKSKNISNVTPISEPLTFDVINNTPALDNKFDLIVASSVFSFIPDYETTLTILKPLLKNDGILIQWDWLSPENNPEFGLSKEKVDNALKATGFKQRLISQPFSLSSSQGSMQVLMAVAKIYSKS